MSAATAVFSAIRHVGLTFVAVVSFFSPAKAQHFPADEHLELMLRYIVEDSIAPGVILGVLEADGSTHIISYGSGGPEAGPMRRHSTFETGSVSKVFVGTLLANMVRRGEVRLEDAVSDYLPDTVEVPSLSGREITLLNLATHRSGLPRDHPFQSARDPFANLTTELLYRVVSETEPSSMPGTRYIYSNIGISLLADALGRAAGDSYAALVQRRILDPLGMSMSSFVLEGEIAQAMTQGHEEDGTQPLYTRPEPVYGPGGLRSNVPDLLKFLAAQVGAPENELEQSMRLAHEPRAVWDDGHIGLAWHIVEILGPPIIWHGGTSGGFTTEIAFDPEKQIGIVVFANVEPFREDLAFSLLVQSLVPPSEWEPVEVDPSVLLQYAGVYESESGNGRYYVHLEDDGWLTYQPVNRARARLYPTSDSTFYMMRGAWSLAFQMSAGGSDVVMQMRQDERSISGGAVVTARKVADDTPSPVAIAGGGWYQPEEGGVSIWGLLMLGAFIILFLFFGPLKPQRGGPYGR
jgi:D-alanyl-D-alanine-carboxypeptidase/D-alanyl-D-alanine-endopeptidase